MSAIPPSLLSSHPPLIPFYVFSCPPTLLMPYMHHTSTQYLFGGDEPRPVGRGGEVAQIFQPLHRQKGQSLTTFCWSNCGCYRHIIMMEVWSDDVLDITCIFIVGGAWDRHNNGYM